MATLYENNYVALNLGNAPVLTPQQTQQLALSNGGRIIAATNPVTFANLFQAFVAHFSTNPGSWKWDPSGAGAYSIQKVGRLLDGNPGINSGECQIFADGLRALWEFPAPFGLGQANSQIRQYQSAHPTGFIGAHPRQGIWGLPPNIYHPIVNHQDPNGRQPLYLWGDHWVVEHTGLFYDPSLNTVYNNLVDMVAMSFQGAANGDFHPVDIEQNNLALGWLQGQRMSIKSEVRLVGNNPVGFIWKGPYRG